VAHLPLGRERRTIDHLTVRREPESDRLGGFGDVLLVLLIGAALMLPGLGAHDLWNPDEPRYGQVCREMRESGDWLIPRLNGEVYGDKPPLMFWAICAGAGLRGGLDETAVRWPSAFAGIGVLALVHGLGSMLFGRRAAWLATLIAASAITIQWKSHVGQIDMLLTFFVVGALACWVSGWLDPRRERWWAFWLLTGIAALAKGPAGLLPPLLSIVVFLALRRDWEGFRRLRPGRGLMLWAAVVLAWLVPAILAGGSEYFGEIVIRQNVTRFANPWHHVKPWYYFATTIPVDFFPWSVMLPAAIVNLVTLPPGRTREGALFVATWITVTILFFSASPGKRGVYILACYPAMALLVGAAIDRLTQAARERDASAPSQMWSIVPAWLLAAALSALNIVLPLVASYRPETQPLGAGFPVLLAIVVFPASVGSLVAAPLATRRRPAAAVASVAIGMALTCTLTFTTLLPRIDAVKSARPLGRILDSVAAPGDRVGVHPRLDPALLYYSSFRMTPLANRDEIEKFIARAGRSWLLAERDDLAGMERELPLVEVARDNDVVEGYILMTTRPWPAGKSDRQQDDGELRPVVGAVQSERVSP
jgi:4-amino-4-deoxy-L-arabinose transferase-like glycosyltransferase